MPAKLFIRFRNQILGAYPLKAGFNVIGGHLTHPIRIEDPDVSRSHAFILGDTEEKIFVLEDMQSPTGTYVNKKRVRKRLLKSNDVITIGRHTLEFLGTDDPPTEIPPEPLGNVPFLVEMKSGKKILLLNETSYFGNGSSDHIHIPALLVGKRFADIAREGHAWTLNLLAKRFAQLKVNGEDVSSAKLKDGDLIDVGGVVFRFFQNPV